MNTDGNSIPRQVLDERVAARREALNSQSHVNAVHQHFRIQFYYQLARQLYSQAQSCAHERAWDDAYIALAKFIRLCANVIPSHQEYHSPNYQKERSWLSKQAQIAGGLFEQIMDGLEEEEREIYEQHLRQQAALSSSALVPPASPIQAKEQAQATVVSLQERFAALKTPSRVVVSSSKAKQRQTPHDQPPPPVDAAPVSSGYPFSSPTRVASSSPTTTYSPISSRYAALKLSSPSTCSSVAYPSVGKAAWMAKRSSSLDKQRSSYQDLMKSSPANPLERSSSSNSVFRTVCIPSQLIARFAQLAEPNTRQPPHGIETCGVLAGKAKDKRLVITTIIVPKQQGSSDNCTMTNEEELYDFCFAHDLLTLGWIHTHPSQTCFLSSVDVHTQCGFQSILPEAISIVYAPKDASKRVGIFRLTEPTGLEFIQSCTLTGFHPHPDHIQIYSDAIACEWDEQLNPQLVDMR